MALRIIHLHDRLSALGGADRHLLALLEHLAGRGECHLLVGRDDGSLPEHERKGLPPWRRVKGLDRSGLSLRGGQAAIRRLAQALEELAPQVIHLHNIMDPKLISLAAGFGPTVMTVQDHRLFCPGAGKLTPEGDICTRVMSEDCAACFREPDYGLRMLELSRQRLQAASGLGALLVLSDYMAAELGAALGAALGAQGLTAPAIEVIPPMVHGIAATVVARPPAHHLFAGRLVERKGVRVALEAARLLRGPLPLVVAGDGALAHEVARAAAQSGGRVRYVGWADRQAMSRLLEEAASLWLPSLWAEPFGISGLEALSLGVPVIASRVGGIADWLAPEAGFLLPPGPGQAPAMARAADAMADQPQRRAAMALAARHTAAKYAPGPLMERLWELYAKLPGV